MTALRFAAVALVSFALGACATSGSENRDPLDAAEWKSTKARMYQDLALQCLRAGDHGRALRLLQQAVQFDARGSESFELLARLAYSQGDFATATGAARRLVQLDPRSIAGLCTLGAVHEAQNRPAEAEACYRDAAKATTDDPRPFIDLHRLLLAAGRDEEATALRLDIAARFPRTIETNLDRGAHLAERREWGNAATAYDEVLAVQPRDAAATAGFALSSVMNGDPSRALALGERLPPHVRADNPSLLLALATAHLAAGDHAAALHELDLGGDPMRARAPMCVLRGEILWRMRQLDAAQVCFERAIELDPETARAHASLGRIHLQQGRWHAAARALQHAVAIEPGNGSSHALLAAALASAGDDAGAEKHFAISKRLPGTAELTAQLERLHPRLRRTDAPVEGAR